MVLVLRWLPRLLAAFGAAWLLSAPVAARADAPIDGVPACGFTLSGPIFQKWNDAGGETSRLGCPAAREHPTAPSPAGSTGRQADFAGGATILWHQTGAHAGQTFTVTGCLYRLYAQFGGPGGWLGLPIGDIANNADGQTQPFEGGMMTQQRADRTCSAEHGPPPSPTVGAYDTPLAQARRFPLELYYDAQRQEYFTTASGLGPDADPNRYALVRVEGYVFADHPPGTTPLRLFWNAARGDHMTVGTAEGELAAHKAGYEFAGGQGFVFSSPTAGAAPLKLFWSLERQDYLLVGTAQGEADAQAAGYEFVRVEGYVSTEPPAAAP
jgi:uncharacterized protein with LGFP repeats